MNERDWRQQLVGSWCKRAFGSEEASSLPQRGIRLLEEAAEAAQATGISEGMALAMIRNVWSRPVGSVPQELGGVGVTALALAEAYGISADWCEHSEIARVLEKPVEHFRERNKANNDAGFKA